MPTPTILYTSLAEIRSFNPCASGWKDILSAHPHSTEDEINQAFPLVDCVESNSISDVCWLLGKRKKELRIVVKFARLCADSVAHLNSKYAADAAAAYAADAADAAGAADYNADYDADAADADAADAAAAYAADAAYAAGAAAAEAAADAATDTAFATYAYDAIAYAIAAAEQKAKSKNKQFLIDCIEDY